MHRTFLIPRVGNGMVMLALLACAGIWTEAAIGQNYGPKTLITYVGEHTLAKLDANVQSVLNENYKQLYEAEFNVEKFGAKTVRLKGLIPGYGELLVTLTNDQKVPYRIDVRPIEEKRLNLLVRELAPGSDVFVRVMHDKRTVILSGTVKEKETADLIEGAIPSAFPEGTKIFVANGIRIGGVQQVQLEVVVAEVNRTETRSMGYSFNIVGNGAFGSSTIGGSGSAASNLAATGAALGAALSGTPNLSGGFVLNNGNSFLNFLEALENDGLAKLTACPRVTTLSGRPGQIVSGGEIPIITTTGLGAANVTYKPFGTVVDFYPVVMGDGKIFLEVRPEVSAPDPSLNVVLQGQFVPAFVSRSANVSVMMEPGQTLAIGGLIQNVTTGNINRVPFLGGLPFIGAAFRSVNYEKQERELIIVVTPRLVDPLAANQLPSHLPGQETRTPDDYELFLEGILEAPRGLRTVIEPGKGFGRYRAPYMSGPNAGLFPCPAGGCSGAIAEPYVSGNISTSSYGSQMSVEQPIYAQPQQKSNPATTPAIEDQPRVLPADAALPTPGEASAEESQMIPSSIPNLPGPSRN